MAKKKRVLFVSSESKPYVATGGLADVSEALPVSLCQNNVIVNKVLPKYKGIEEKFPLKKKFTFLVEMGKGPALATVYHLKDEGVNTYFIANDYYFERDSIYGYDDDGERFGFFSKAAVEMTMILNFMPDIVHLNDWQSAMIALFLKSEYRNIEFYKGAKVIYTIHNLQYQGVFNKYVLNEMNLSDRYFNPDEIEYYGKICFMKAGIIYSDIVSTVSETYANEIQTADFAYGLDGILSKYSNKLRGILNGVYYDKYDPKTDEFLDYNYDKNNFSTIRTKQKRAFQKELKLAQKDIPIFAVVTRLVEQKGIELISLVIREILSKDIQFVLLGSGEEHYEQDFKKLEEEYPDKVKINIGYDEILARKIYASSDFFLMPSLFEPCGLSQMYSLRYGALPIVRSTGGLKDSIVDYYTDKKRGTGFKFDNYTAEDFLSSVEKAIALYSDKKAMKAVIKRAMNEEFSWDESSKKYIELYDEMLK